MEAATMHFDWITIAAAIALTAIAGLSTSIGAALSIVGKGPGNKTTAYALGLSAGVMIYISFVELLPEAALEFAKLSGEKDSLGLAALTFFAGMGLMALIDWIIPEDENPHEMHSMQELREPGNHHLKRTGFMLALAIGIHNFPEGMATFISALDGLSVALPIVVAIAIHNIPEGVAVAVPIFKSTGSRRKAFKFSLIAGLAEPLGAIIGAILLLPFWTPLTSAIALAATAGIMVYISFDELLPSAESYGCHHISLIGIISGMAVMALSIWLLH